MTVSMEKHCVAWSDVPEEVSASGVGKRTLAGRCVSLTMVRIPAGTVAPRHNHPHEQFVQVISGSGVLETDQGAFPFAAGSVFQFPRQEWHAARFDTDTVLVETNLPT